MTRDQTFWSESSKQWGEHNPIVNQETYEVTCEKCKVHFPCPDKSELMDKILEKIQEETNGDN